VEGGEGGEKGGGRRRTRDTVERYDTLAAVAGGISSSAKFTTSRGSLRGADFLRFPLSKAEPRRDMSEGFAQFLTMFMRLCVEHDASSSHVIGRLA
jgi:hypothetical protein